MRTTANEFFDDVAIKGENDDGEMKNEVSTSAERGNKNGKLASVVRSTYVYG